MNTLVGFENEDKLCRGYRFNFILSNGNRSTQIDEYDPTKYTFMVPADALNQIRSVKIFHNSYHIVCFSFLDKNGAPLWKIGETCGS